MVFQEFFASEERRIYLILIALAVVLLAVFLISRARRPLSRKIEERIRKKDYMSREDFLDSWKEDKEDFPGCYVILLYDKKMIFNPMNYDDIYVGQSVHVRHRVFSHLMGHGNGNVYFGAKSGCRVYVLIAPCKKKNLNRTEKELISYFDATSSLNKTRGGAARR